MYNFKKAAIGVAATIPLSLAITACGGATEATIPNVSPGGGGNSTSDRFNIHSQFIEHNYLQVVKGYGLTQDDKTLLNGAKIACGLLQNGAATYDQLLMEVSLNPGQTVVDGIDNDDMPYVMGAGIAGFCPEFRADVEAW